MCEGEDMENEKARLIKKPFTKMCDICFLIDSEAPAGTKWFVYKEGIDKDSDSYICEGCYEGLKALKLQIHQKIDNPKHNHLDKYIPWFAKEVPGMVEIFQKLYEETKT